MIRFILVMIVIALIMGSCASVRRDCRGTKHYYDRRSGLYI